MSKFKIAGNTTLEGEIEVAGNKNAALPILAATVLTDQTCDLRNVPDIADVRAMLKLLKSLGKNIEKKSDNHFEIDGKIEAKKLDEKLAKKLRASILFLSGLLAREGQVEMPPPGGCVIGRRKVDTHFQVVDHFAGTVELMDNGNYFAKIDNPQSGKLFLNEVSVTGTENALIMAAAIPEETVIYNAACEPHVADLANFLVKMGAEIDGIGTNQLVIKGSKKLSGTSHRIAPDHIEAGTFAIAAACTGGDLIIHDAIKNDLISTIRVLKGFNVDFEFLDEKTLHVKASQLKSVTSKVQVGLWPNFPTDLMSPVIVLATQAKGATLCHDWMYESRMYFVDKLNMMGANIIQADPHRVIVNGPSPLKGQHLSSPDIRAGIAIIIAAMIAEDESIIDRVEIVDRGYENIENRLNSLGADILRIED
ncbi:MAG TPA: UDP-N-acetylglucosamine 1-carboxyvinyltransferase [bacterium]|nr:UDP-N-acetylglucosamine 1-carboxyvinyltransferase [bacterium]